MHIAYFYQLSSSCRFYVSYCRSCAIRGRRVSFKYTIQGAQNNKQVKKKVLGSSNKLGVGGGEGGSRP
jgi:hypothetical protein